MPKEKTTQQADTQNAFSPDNEQAFAASGTYQESARQEQEAAASPAPLFSEVSPLGHALGRVMRAVIFAEKPLPELDALPLAQMRLLLTIFHTPDATMKDYSERLEVSQSTVTQIADRLIKRGLVERRTDPDDRRIVRLDVSSTGAQTLVTAQERRHQNELAIWEELTAEEREAVMRGLEILGRTAEAIRAKQGRPLPPMPVYRSPANTVQPADAETADSPVVDLMTRRVRGKSA